jgi:hypothetical protein
VILCLSLVVIIVIPFLDISFIPIPFTGNIHWIFLIFRLITLPLWLILINHVEILLRSGTLDLFIRSLGFYTYPSSPFRLLQLQAVDLILAWLPTIVAIGAVTSTNHQ